MVYILLLPPATEQSRSNSKYTMNQWRSISKKDILNPTQKQKQNAIPGTSEHQLGLGVDINADGINSYGYEVYNWLAQNAYGYGFIYRYPENKVTITGIANEPWHYRYVGVNAATEIYKRGICLEEYLGETN